MKEEEAHSEIESKKMAPYKCGCGLIFDSPIDYVKHKKGDIQSKRNSNWRPAAKALGLI